MTRIFSPALDPVAGIPTQGTYLPTDEIHGGSIEDDSGFAKPSDGFHAGATWLLPEKLAANREKALTLADDVHNRLSRKFGRRNYGRYMTPEEYDALVDDD